MDERRVVFDPAVPTDIIEVDREQLADPKESTNGEESSESGRESVACFEAGYDCWDGKIFSVTRSVQADKQT